VLAEQTCPAWPCKMNQPDTVPWNSSSIRDRLTACPYLYSKACQGRG